MNRTGTRTKFFNFFRMALRGRFAESLLLPFTNGSNWNSFVARIPANYYQYRPGTMRSVVRNEIRFELDLSEYMQWLIYFGIQTEPREKMYALLRSGMHVIDIGANIGETTLMFSRLCGVNGKVASFEPFPSTFKRLEHHLALNSCPNVLPVNRALGQREETVYMETVSGNSGGNQVTTGAAKTEVICTTLDKWLNEQTGFEPSFIKIDVEGYEQQVLLGARATLKRFSPLLFIEINDHFLQRAGNSGEELFTYLESFGYRLADADTGQPVTRQDLARPHFDIIARKN